MEVSVFQRPPRCGLGKCHPSCLQVFLNIKCFTFFLSLFALMSGMFPMYLVSQITTIEKHFGLSSKRSGMIVGAGEIGFLLTVIFVGHFLNTSHRPRVLAGCAFIMSAAATFMAIPFFVYGAPYDDNGIESFEEKNNDMLCLRNHSQTPGCGNATDVGAVDGDHAFGMFIFAAILSGCGATGLWSVGIAYIDDNAGKKQSAFYLGIMFCLRSIAPVIGLMFGAGVSYISVDFKDRNLSRDHPSWIGAWWVGFLVIGTITFITGIPLLFYPKMLPKAKKRKLSTASMSESDPNKRRRSVVERAAEESKVLAKSK